MAETFVVAVQGIKELPIGTDWSEAVNRAALQATNKTADWARAESARLIADQVAFPAAYLRPSGNRLTVSKQAKSSDLEAIITGRGRPTSLARFVCGSSQPNDPGVTVTVQPGKARYMRRAFLIRLRAGSADLDTKSNLGLAVRLKRGERLKNKTRAVLMRNGLYLLYGPGIDQVFDDVAEDVAPDAAEYMDREFRRLLKL